MSVQVIGYTDDVPVPEGARFSDNPALGMARAVIVAEGLRLAGNLPPKSVTAVGAGEVGAPYANDSRVNRRRNRTVVIRIAQGN